MPVRQLAAMSFQSSAPLGNAPLSGLVAEATPGLGKRDECAICLGDLSQPAGAAAGPQVPGVPGWLRQLPCGHVFHPRCICDWLVTEHRCPMCRFDLRANREAT